jgi:hypothetical protein
MILTEEQQKRAAEFLRQIAGRQGLTIRVKLKEEFGGVVVVGVIFGFTSFRVTLSDACYQEADGVGAEIGMLPMNFTAIESIEAA